MINRIAKSILGVPVVSFIWIMAAIGNTICFLIFISYDWLVGNDTSINFVVFEKLTPKSPLQFLKIVWRLNK